MQKVQVDVAELQIGMYVADLDRPWRETPFLFQGFEIRTQEEIDALRRYCRTVQVLLRDPERSGALPRKSAVPGYFSSEIMSPRQQALRIEQEMFKLNNHPTARSLYEDITTLEEEVQGAAEIYDEARVLLNEAMADARFGRSLNVPGVKRLVGGMVESILRNPDALTCFAQLKNKDDYTAMHSLRAAVLALVFGRQLGMPREQLLVLGLGALLQDVGKSKLPSELLNKPDALTAEENRLMKQHVNFSIEIVSAAPNVPSAALEVVSNHHERYDGSGYLKGLRGDDIGVLGAIGSIVDQYDAMTSERPYRMPVAAHAVLKQMYEWRGRLFHPEMVEKFIQCLGIYPIGSIVQLNTGEVAVVATMNRKQRLKPRVVLVRKPDMTPYTDRPLVNMVERRTPEGRTCEIEHVLEPAAVGIDPAQYLPIQIRLSAA
jgi:HD-GYP domain-containing protein (c-di-GMP phosphodiesterase class II)